MALKTDVINHRLILSVVCFFNMANVVAQGKLPLDTCVFSSWEQVHGGRLSSDGNYYLYYTSSGQLDPSTVWIGNTNSNWKMSIPFSKNAAFTNNSHSLVYITGSDSLCQLKLGSTTTRFIGRTSGFQLINFRGAEWLTYVDEERNTLEMLSMNDIQKRTYNDVFYYQLSPDKQFLLTLSFTHVHDSVKMSLRHLSSGKELDSWITGLPSKIVVTNGASQIAWNSANTERKMIWVVNRNNRDRRILRLSLPEGYALDDLIAFTENRGQIVFSVKPSTVVQCSRKIGVNVWNDTDALLQSQQVDELGQQRFLFAVSLADGKIRRLQLPNETISFEVKDGVFPNYGIANTHISWRNNEKYWNKIIQGRNDYLFSLDGRKQLPLFFASLSPNQQYIVGYDSLSIDLFVYNPRTEEIINLTHKLGIPEGDVVSDRPGTPRRSRGIRVTGWLKDDEAVLVYDRFDIWQFDPTGEKPPISLTNGFGRKHGIVFRFSSYASDHPPTYANGKEIIITAFNPKTKTNGYYKMTVGLANDPTRLTEGSFVYDVPDKPFLHGEGLKKAASAHTYMVLRSSSSAPPNYFVTSDFQNFNQVSFVNPQTEYNWMTCDLVNFKTLDGKSEQGLIYKPENFAPKKKYPVIIQYYEQRSDELNKFIKPNDNWSTGGGGGLDIPWFVSHGYIVAVPDIHYEFGKIGQSAFNSIIAFTEFVSELPFVDRAKIGTQGFSFGGFETNYLLTHTNRFAAAISACGPVNLISLNGALAVGGPIESNAFQNEIGQNRMAASIWEQPRRYIDNSPLFELDQMTAPLLSIANKLDYNVPFGQGLELFSGAHRLGRSIWMFQYDNNSHGLSYDGRGAGALVDYVLRSQQFFDYFLKGTPWAKWMHEPAFAVDKGKLTP